MVKPIAKTIHKTKIDTAKLSVSELHEAISQITQKTDNLQKEIDDLRYFIFDNSAPTTAEKLLFMTVSMISSAFVAYATVQLSQ